MKNRFLNSSIAAKFKGMYLVAIIVCIFSNAAATRFLYSYEMKNTVSGLASQTMETISNNVESMLDSISKSSTYLLGTTDVQNYLLNFSKEHNAIQARNLRNTLYLSLETMPIVSSIIIMDEDGKWEGAARYSLPEMEKDRPREAEWYEEVRTHKGTPIYRINGGGYFRPTEEMNEISLIRLINSTETARPLGYMLINISADSLLSFARENNDNYSDICMCVEDEVLLDFLNPSLNSWLQNQSLQTMKDESDILAENERYLLLKFQDKKQDWYYLGAIKYQMFSSRFHSLAVLMILTLIISAAMFLLIAFGTNRFITVPIGKLMRAMKKSEDGNLRPAAVTIYHDEIGQLQQAYNELVEKIKELMDAKIAEQKLLRKAELNTLQEQMKPHFLYNSLSALSYLVTSKQNDTAYEMLMSLSEYYRESLSKGSEIIPLSTEVNIVRNYLKLQKLRFREMFDDVYMIEDQVLQINIPRLILQPLVENALYHGILPTGEFGTIKVEAFLKDNLFIIRVSDDGIGIDQKTIQTVLSNQLENNQKSFGLRGTIERLRIFYETQDIYQIASKPDWGTVITISIPVEKTEGAHES